MDNLGTTGCSRDEVARVLNEVTSISERDGLAVHDLEMSDGRTKPLGVVSDSPLLTTAVTRERFWRLSERSVTSWQEGKRTARCWRYWHCTDAVLVLRPVFECVPLCVPISCRLSEGDKLRCGQKWSKSCQPSEA